jgi:hypothetical protein
MSLTPTYHVIQDEAGNNPSLNTYMTISASGTLTIDVSSSSGIVPGFRIIKIIV